MGDLQYLEITRYITENMDVVWTFLLLVVRHTALISLLPGIGMGSKGIGVRTAGIITFSYAAVLSSPTVALPDTWMLVISQAFSELLLGSLIGFIPAMIISGVQMGAQLSSTTMGLGAGNLVDPTLGVNVTSIAKLFGDLVVALFLLSGGHYVVFYAISGLGGEIVPGTFLLSENTVGLLINRTGDIFRVGVMISAPVIVALLLTQFVMGLISKAIPTVNIFIVSFPLTIGIGLILSALSLPDVATFVSKELIGIENSVAVVLDDTTHLKVDEASGP